MKIFEGLQKHQAVGINGKYVVQLEHNYSRQYYEVNGEKASASQVVVDSLDSIKKITPSHPKLIHYTREDGSIVTPKELTEFDKKWEDYEDEYDGMDFGDSVDIEIQYVKEKSQFKNLTPVYEDTEVLGEDVEIAIVGSCEDTGSDFITTPFVYGQVKWEGHSTGVYKLDRSAVASNQLRKLMEKYPDTRWSIPNHSHLGFVQVDGKYVFTKSGKDYIKNAGKCMVYSKLEDAKKEEEAVRKFVYEELMLHLEPSSATDVQIRDFVENLNKIRDRVGELDVKVKSESSKRSLLGSVNKLISEYKEK